MGSLFVKCYISFLTMEHSHSSYIQNNQTAFRRMGHLFFYLIQNGGVMYFVPLKPPPINN